MRLRRVESGLAPGDGEVLSAPVSPKMLKKPNKNRGLIPFSYLQELTLKDIVVFPRELLK